MKNHAEVCKWLLENVTRRRRIAASYAIDHLATYTLVRKGLMAAIDSAELIDPGNDPGES